MELAVLAAGDFVCDGLEADAGGGRLCGCDRFVCRLPAGDGGCFCLGKLDVILKSEQTLVKAPVLVACYSCGGYPHEAEDILFLCCRHPLQYIPYL